ncbi:eukaryotic translation initiation factor 4E [Hortaea werneckii]|nr:eukaryotic translation initiation factor 4E [Hortaea werneckii]
MPPVSSSVKQVSVLASSSSHALLDGHMLHTVDKHFKRTVVAVRRVGMSTELDLLLVRQLQVVLEALADLFQPLLAGLTVCLALLDLGSLLTALLRRLASRTCPETHTPEGLTDVDHDTHNLVVAFVLQSLADGSEHHIEPGGVLSLAVLERVGPAATELVLRVLPFRAHAALEEVVVRLLGKLRGRGDVVLEQAHVSLVHFCMVCLEGHTYVDAPELLDGVKGDDLLQQLAPVLLAAGRLGEPECPGVLQRMLDIEIGRVVKHSDDLAVICTLVVGSIGYTALGRDWNGIKRNLLVGHRLRDLGHGGWFIGAVLLVDRCDFAPGRVGAGGVNGSPKCCSNCDSDRRQSSPRFADASPKRATARTVIMDLQAPGVTTLSRSVRRLPRSISSVQMTSVSISTTPTLSSPDITLHRLVSYLGTLIATGLLGLCLQTRKMNHGYQVPICVMKLKL